MFSIPFKNLKSKSYATQNSRALGKFLKLCKLWARIKGRAQLVHISVEVDYIDPLAVLQSIYEPGEKHFYLEQPSQKKALAGAEAIVSRTFNGPNRFEAVKAFSKDILKNTIAVGDLHLSSSGPHFFCGFTFFDELQSPNEPFAPATVFVPRWQVGFENGKYVAIANCLVDKNTDTHALVEKVWAAHNKFSSYSKKPPIAESSKDFSITQTEVVKDHTQVVAHALKDIENGFYQKVALARAIDLSQEGLWKPLESLNKLRQKYPTCYSFSFANESGQSFIGATPEKILRIQNKNLYTEAIAGSAPRSKNALEDSTQAKTLLESPKDNHEHQLIVDSIVPALKSLKLSPQVAPKPQLLTLANIHHLMTPIQAKLKSSVHLLDALAALHPTPAVGGTPKKAAQKAIKKLESFPRGLYAGPLGYFNAKGNGEFIVGIRSALIDQNTARLYAGGGIVKGSDPIQETQETNWKFQALLKTLGIKGEF